MKLKEIRAKYPQYDHLTDDDLSRALYNKFYAGKMDYEAFRTKTWHAEQGPASPQYGVLDKAKYAARAGAEGLLFGLGDVAAGVINTQVAPLAKTISALKEGTPLTLADFNPAKNFKEGRGDFVREQDAFKQAHPGLNMGGEIAGGLVSGLGGAAKTAGMKGLARLGKWGAAAASGAGSGAAFGFGGGLTRNAQKLDAREALKQAAAGGVLGAGFGLAAPAAFGAGGKAVRALSKSNRTFKKVARAAGEDLEKSIETGTPLLDIGNPKVAKLGKTAKRASEKAGDLLDEHVEKGFSRQGETLHGIVKKYIPSTGEETAQGLLDAKAALAQQAYKPLEELGALTKRSRSMANAIKESPQIQAAIAMAKRNVPQLRNLPNSDFRVLNEAKKILDAKAQFNPMATGAEKTKIRYAQAARRRLIDEIDAATDGVYKQTLAKYGDLLGAERALSRGRELLNMEPSAAAAVYNRAADAEREALRVGLAQELHKRIRKSNFTDTTRNTARALAGSEQNKKLFRAVLGKDAEKFINELSGVERAVKNYGVVKGGSDTAENLMRLSEGMGFLRRPVEAAVNLGGKALDWTLGLNQEQVARMLIDPGYATLMRAKAGALPPQAYTSISGAGGVFSHIAGPLTGGEKRTLRKEIQGNLLKNVRGTAVENPHVMGGKIQFNRPGIDKAASSGQDLEKLKMLQYAPEISKMGTPYQPPRRANNEWYEYLMTPVEADAKKTAAATTLRNGYFYNVNPVDYAIKMRQKLVVPLTKRGPSDALGPRRVSPIQTEAFAKGSNSISPKKRIVKPFTMKDFLILLGRPWTLGLEGNIGRENLNREKH